MTRLISYIILSLGISFYCSLMEAILLSASPAAIEASAQRAKRFRRLIRGLTSNMDRSLSAVLTINSVAQIMGSVAVGAQVASEFGNEALAVGSMILTFCMLFGTEILPKVIGVKFWRRFIFPAAVSVRIMILMAYPLVIFFEWLSKLLSGGAVKSPKWTRDEMIMAAEQGKSEGTLVEKETKIITNLLRLNLIYVQDVMTPREKVSMFEKNQSVADVVEAHGHDMYSRIPVYDKILEDVVGLVLRFHIFNAESDDLFDMKMNEIMSPIYKVRNSQTLAKVIDEFIQRREHLFAVVDENQKFVGVITLEDVIETLLGVEIEDEIDNAEEIREKARKLWQARAHLWTDEDKIRK